jgi:glycine/D-amino acid oxidase-like deaminating enzyme
MLISLTSVPRRGMIVTNLSRLSRCTASRTGVRPAPRRRVSSSSRRRVPRRQLDADGYENAYVSTGHAMLGITLAPASGQALAEYLSTGRRPDVLRPFRFDRF